MIITIDGPAASGKSSVAISLSRQLGFVCISSGAAYRAITKIVIDNNFESRREDQIYSFLDTALKSFTIAWHCDDMGMRISLNGVDITNDLFSSVVDLYVSKIAAIDLVRNCVNKTLFEISIKNQNTLFEGRDMGSTVFPNADIKIFLVASSLSRAKRRFEQLKDKSMTSVEKIYEDMIVRDKLDSERSISPLSIPEGAFVFDNSEYSLEETVTILKERILLFMDVVPK